MTTALVYPNADGIRTQTLECTDQAESLVVTNEAEYLCAAGFLKRVKNILKQITETFDRPIADAHAAHKSVIAAKKKHADPLTAAERTVKGKMLAWQRAETDRLEAERREVEAAERKREEERRLAEAERLEVQGRTAEAEAVIDEPVYIPPVVMPPAAPKVAGISSRRVWKYRIVDVNLIPRQYMIPNDVAIGAVVRSMGKAMNIPGVEVYQEDVMAVR